MVARAEREEAEVPVNSGDSDLNLESGVRHLVPRDGESVHAPSDKPKAPANRTLREQPDGESSTVSHGKGRILVVDDDPLVRRSVARVLVANGYSVTTSHDGRDAVVQAQHSEFDAILSDIAMPSMDGIELLRQIRQYDLLVPVVLITGEPAVATAVQAIEYGVLNYLTKPVSNEDILSVVEKAVRLHRVARVRQQAAELMGRAGAMATDRAGLEANFERFMDTFWMAFHPIIDPRSREIFGFEALLRSNEPTLPTPDAVLDAAERLGRLTMLDRTIRAKTASHVVDAPADTVVFVNLHVTDLLDATLISRDAPLSSHAARIVLEITERASLDEVRDARARIARLREIGFRIAIDDLGAGYSGLTSFALLEPEFVKLDMSLIRGVSTSLTKQKVIRSMTSLSQDMGMKVVAEGVETLDEADTLTALGCDYLQGFLFARPGRPFPQPRWPWP